MPDVPRGSGFGAARKRAYFREYYLRHRERKLAMAHDWYLNNKERRLALDLKKYGKTIEWYREQLARQNGVCAICLNPPTSKRLMVDHDHTTGEVRGLLCHACNIAMERLDSITDWVKRAEAYRA